MVKHTKGFKGLSKKVLSAILAASMIMTSSSFVMAAEPTDVAVESVAEDAATGKANQGITKEEVEAGFEEATYNGEVQHPVLKIRGETEESGLFHVNYIGDCVDAGTYTAEVTFDGAWSGTLPVEAEFEIKQADISDADVEVEAADTFEYNGTSQRPGIAVTTTLGSGEEEYDYTLQDDEYEVAYVPAENGDEKGISVGKYSITVKATADGNFTGAREDAATYSIVKTEMSDSLVKVEAEDIPYAEYDSEALKNAVTVTDIGLDEELEPEEYKITVEDEETAGDLGVHNFVVEPENAKNYAGGKVEGQYKVVPSESFASILESVKIAPKEYDNGKDVDVYADAVADAKERIEDIIKPSEYKIVTPESDWNNAGEYTLVVEGQQIYDGQTAEITVVVEPKAITNDGSDLHPDMKVNVAQGTHPGSGDVADLVVTVTDNKIELVEGTDYVYETVEEKGVKYVEITGIGNYTTENKEADVKVYKVSYNVDDQMFLNDPSISYSVEKDDIVYTGSKITLSNSDIVFKETDGSDVITLRPGKDYYIDERTYKNNELPGTATVTVKGMGDYKGSVTVEFEIVGTSFADSFDVSMKKDTFENGTTKKVVDSNVVVRSKGSTGTFSKYDVEYLKDGKTYTSARFTPGAYVARVSADKTEAPAYSGYVDLDFIVLGDEVDFNVSAVEDQVYTGEQITPAVTVTLKDDEKETLKEGEDYEVVYGENVQAGNNAGTVTVNMIGEYSGSSTVYFNITKAAQTIEMTNPAQSRDLANGTRRTSNGTNAAAGRNCTLKLGFAVPDTMNLSYDSSDDSVATVSNGVITYQGVGECTITVTANETNNCEAYTLEIPVKVGDLGTPYFKPFVTSRTANKAITVTSYAVRGADGFEVEYSIRPDWWRSTKLDFEGTSRLYRQTLKTYHSKRTYYIRVRAYQIVDGEKDYSAWSDVATAMPK